jgi:hypothetical protein
MAAKDIKVQILNDGYRNTTVKISGYVNADDYTNQSIVAAASLGQVDAQGSKAKALRVTRINYDVEDALQVDLIWGGGTPTSLWHATGRGEMEGRDFGGIVDDATTPDYTILLTTKGGAVATTDLAFSIVLEIVKAS